MSGPGTFEEAFREICRAEAPLRERLAALARAIREYEPLFADAYDELVGRLEASTEARNFPRVGVPLPRFMLPDQNGRIVDSERLVAKGPVVVSFNRGHWCEFCDVELRAFAAAHSEIVSQGACVVSIMPENGEFTRKVWERLGRAFPVLSDMDNEYALMLDLVIWLGDRVAVLLRASGVDLERAQGNRMWFVPIPATLVVDRGGLIVAAFVDPDFRRRMDMSSVLQALEVTRDRRRPR